MSGVVNLKGYMQLDHKQQLSIIKSGNEIDQLQILGQYGVGQNNKTEGRSIKREGGER